MKADIELKRFHIILSHEAMKKQEKELANQSEKEIINEWHT